MLMLAASGAAAQGPSGPQIGRIADLPQAFTGCFQLPDGLQRLETVEITVRFALNRKGELIGTPRATFSTLTIDQKGRQLLTQAVIEGMRRCTPLNLSDGLGAAIAGRPISTRFIFQGPRGRGA